MSRFDFIPSRLQAATAGPRADQARGGLSASVSLYLTTLLRPAALAW
jgi:hypothetical protein